MGLSQSTCSKFTKSGVSLSPDNKAPSQILRVSLEICSMKDGPDVYGLLEDFVGDDPGPIAIPCREISVGKQKIPWAIVTPDYEEFIVDGDEIGSPPWSFLAVSWKNFQSIKTLLYEDTNLIKTFLGILSTQAQDDYAWCYFKTPEANPALSIDRARVILFETLTKALGDQAKPVENFVKRVREIEQMLNPSLLTGRLEIDKVDQGFEETLRVFDGEVKRLEKIRKTLWTL